MTTDAQVTETGQTELPLAAPAVASWLQTRLPPGNVLVVAYVRYADSAATTPLGLPAGARLQSAPLQMQPLLQLLAAAAAPSGGVLQGSGRRLQSAMPGDCTFTHAPVIEIRHHHLLRAGGTDLWPERGKL